MQNAQTQLVPGDYISFTLGLQKHHAIVRSVTNEYRIDVIHISGMEGDTLSGFKTGFSITSINIANTKVLMYNYDPDFVRKDGKRPDNVALMIGRNAMSEAFKRLSCKELCTYCITGEIGVSSSNSHENKAERKKDIDSLIFQIDQSILRKREQNHKIDSIQKRENDLPRMTEHQKTVDFDETSAEIHKEKLFQDTVAFTSHVNGKANDIDKDETNVSEMLFKEISKSDELDSSVKKISQYSPERETPDDINQDELQNEKPAKSLTVLETVDENASVMATYSLQLKDDHSSDTGRSKEDNDENKQNELVKDNPDQINFSTDVDHICQINENINIDKLENELKLRNKSMVMFDTGDKTVVFRTEGTQPVEYLNISNIDDKTTGQLKKKIENLELSNVKPNKDEVKTNELIKDRNKVQEQILKEKSNIETVKSNETNICQHEMEKETTTGKEKNGMEKENTYTQMRAIIDKIDTKARGNIQNEIHYSETTQKFDENDGIECNLTANGLHISVQRSGICNLSKPEGKLLTKRSSLVIVDNDENIIETQVFESRTEENSADLEYSGFESNKNFKKEEMSSEAKQNKNNVHDQISDTKINICTAIQNQYQHEIEERKTTEVWFVETEKRMLMAIKAIPKIVEHSNVHGFHIRDEKQNHSYSAGPFNDTEYNTEMNELIEDSLQKTNNKMFKKVYDTLQIESKSTVMIETREQTPQATLDGKQLKKYSFLDGEVYDTSQFVSTVRQNICQSNEDNAKREEDELYAKTTSVHIDEHLSKNLIDYTEPKN